MEATDNVSEIVKKLKDKVETVLKANKQLKERKDYLKMQGEYLVKEIKKLEDEIAKAKNTLREITHNNSEEEKGISIKDTKPSSSLPVMIKGYNKTIIEVMKENKE